jgi:phosphatidylinositol alpha-1,6-mannosyltransferase
VTNAPDSARKLLILAPSMGFGGGIERMGSAAEEAWAGPVGRVNLYLPDEVTVPEGNLAAKLRFTRRALRAGWRQRPDVVLALHVNFLPVAFAIRRLVGARVAVFGIGVEVWAPFSRWIRELIARCDRILAISAFTAELMAARAGIAASRITVVPLPIDERIARAAFGGADRAAVTEAEQICLITVTRLVPEHRFKGCFEIAEAMPSVLAQRSNVRWVLVGHGADLPVIRERCRELGIGHAVEITDRIDDDELADRYRQADVFVLPSTADPEADPPVGEGFGLVFAEAGAFGLPSIGSTAGGGSLEIISHGENGVNVPPHDPGALVQAILELVGNPDLRRRLGANARERVRSRHMLPHFAEALRRALS